MFRPDGVGVNMWTSAFVIPAKAGIHRSTVGTSNVLKNQGRGALDSGLRRNDGVLGMAVETLAGDRLGFAGHGWRGRVIAV